MANENTPLSQFAQNVFTKENFEIASRAAKEKAIEVRRQAQEGDLSLRLLAFLGGLIVIVVSSMEFLANILTLNSIGAFIAIFTLLLGIVVILLEGNSFILSSGAVNSIHKYALFLKFLWGRGCLYFICGALQLYQLDVLHLVSGAYMCAVGILFVLVGQRTAWKLKALRKSLYSEQTLHSKFSQADIDGDGGLNLQQFRTLTLTLGLDMTRRETEAAFMHMHKADTNGEKLTYDEFKTWWNETDADEEIDEKAFVFV
jgi:hypothetical protein